MSAQPSVDDMIALCAKAGEAAREHKNAVGAHLGEAFPVTQADRAANDVLEAGLSHFGFPVVSEENSESIPEHGYAFVIDPLDGTSDFVAGTRDWCVMAAFVKDKAALQGVVYAPDRGEWWYATQGAGAWYGNGGPARRISVSDVSNPNAARMVVSVSHPSAAAEAVRTAFGAQPIPVGSIGIKLGFIAMGEAESYWTDAPLGIWDVCAPSLILQEAGGLATDIRGEPLLLSDPSRRVQKGLAASNGHLHEALIRAALSS